MEEPAQTNLANRTKVNFIRNPIPTQRSSPTSLTITLDRNRCLSKPLDIRRILLTHRIAQARRSTKSKTGGCETNSCDVVGFVNSYVFFRGI
jgi:hypothetical protein